MQVLKVKVVDYINLDAESYPTCVKTDRTFWATIPATSFFGPAFLFVLSFFHGHTLVEISVNSCCPVCGMCASVV